MTTRTLLAALLAGMTLVGTASVVAKPRAVRGAKTKASKCFELGRLLGSTYFSLDASGRARGKILESYCREVRDPTLGRIPTERDVDTLAAELAATVRRKNDKPFVDTKPLDEQIRTGNEQERELLDSLLQQ